MRGRLVESVYLVITGTVEMIESGSPVNGMLSAGAMLGEVAGIEGTRARKNYRAASFVQALKVSVAFTASSSNATACCKMSWRWKSGAIFCVRLGFAPSH